MTVSVLGICRCNRDVAPGNFIIVGSTTTLRTAALTTAAIVVISVAAGFGTKQYQSVQIE